ncbi:DUF2627 domain-containing protein [Shigella flexneri]|nr:DUF2627 domain-containing protein [Shigella flexneri]
MCGIFSKEVLGKHVG